MFALLISDHFPVGDEDWFFEVCEEQLLKDNMPKLHELAKYLYEKETITGDEFMEILNLSPDQLTTTRMETN